MSRRVKSRRRSRLDLANAPTRRSETRGERREQGDGRRGSRSRPDLTPDPTARIDIALMRLLTVAVERQTDPVIRMLYNELQPTINEALSFAVGPGTGIGNASRAAVRGLQIVARGRAQSQSQSQPQYGNGNGGGNGGAA